MNRIERNSGINFLIGVSFLSPVVYSVVFFDMAVIQRMFYFSTSLLIFLIYLLKIRNDDQILFNRPLFILILIFPMLFLTSLLNGSSSLLILKLSEMIIPFCIMLHTAILIIILGEQRFFKVIGYSAVIISTLFSIIGILEVFQIKLLQLPTMVPPGSTLGNRSFAAEYLLSSIPFILILNSYIKKDRKILLFIAAVLNVSFLLFTRNRSSILILFVVVLIYLGYILWNKKNERKFRSLLPVLSILIISFTISLIPIKDSDRPDLKSTASTLLDTEYKTNVLRLNFWSASFQMISENPVTGIGLFKWSGYYPKYSGEYFTDENIAYVHNINAHNDFLELFAESGITASLFFFSIYLLILFSLFQRIKLNQNYFALLLTFLVTFAFSFVAFPNQKFSSYYLAAISAGTILIKIETSGKNKIAVKFKHLKWLLFLLIIFGMITSYIKLKSELSFGEAIYFKDRKQYGLMIQKLSEVSEVFYPIDVSKQPVDYYRGIANFFLGRGSDALENNLKAADIAPFNPLVLRNTAGIYHSLGKVNLAMEKYELIRNLFPNYVDAQINLLNIYAETGQSEKSKILYEELLKKSNQNPRLNEYAKKYHVN